jgi:hypothetical protein
VGRIMGPFLKSYTIAKKGLFIIKNQKNNESDRRNNCHPNHELKHKVLPWTCVP